MVNQFSKLVSQLTRTHNPLHGVDDLAGAPGGFLQGIRPIAQSEPPRRGTPEILAAWRTMPWLRAATRRIAKVVGATEWQVFVQRNTTTAAFTRDRKAQRLIGVAREKHLKEMQRKGELVEVENHIVLDLLVNSNPFFPGTSAMELIQIYNDTIGESIFLKERNQQMVVVRLWPIPATWVKNLPTLADPTFEIREGRFDEKVPMEDVIFFKHHDPQNPYGRGTGTGVSLADEVETDEYAAKHTKAFFYNRARPDTIISGSGLSTKETKRIESDYLRRHQGFWKHFKPWFLSTDIKVHTLSNDFSDQKVTELRRFERDTILQVLEAPPEIMGIMENANRASADAAFAHFMRLAIVPRLEFLRSILQVTLVEEFDERLILGYVSPVPDDKEFQLKVMARAPWAFDIDEWRALASTAPLNGEIGTLHPIQSGLQFAQPEELEAVNEIDPVVAGLPVDENSRQFLENRTKVLSELPEGLMGPEDLVPPTKQVTKVLTNADIEQIVNALDPEDLDEPTRAIYANTVSDFANSMIDSTGLSVMWDESDPNVVNFLSDYSSTRITGINDTTRGRVRAVLAEGRDLGETSAQLGQRVSGVMDEARGARAFTIARTETVGAAGFANNDALVQAQVEGKEWLTTRDSEVRDTHQGLDSKAIKVSAEFTTSSGNSALHPGGFGIAEEDINCRCTILAVLDLSNRSAMTAEQKDAAWKAFEDDREPHERLLRAGFRSGFSTQEPKVLAELRRLG